MIFKLHNNQIYNKHSKINIILAKQRYKTNNLNTILNYINNQILNFN